MVTENKCLFFLSNTGNQKRYLSSQLSFKIRCTNACSTLLYCIARPVHQCQLCIVTVCKHHHTQNTVWMTWAVGGINRAVAFVIWCANRNCSADIQQVKWHTDSQALLFFLKFPNNDITGQKFYACLFCVWSTDKRWWRGVRSAASQRINGAQPTHCCVDEENPLLIIQNCPPNLDGHSLGVMEKNTERETERDEEFLSSQL